MVCEYARSFALGRWPFLAPGSVKKWNATDIDKSDGE